MNRYQIMPPLLHSFDDQTGDVQGTSDGNVAAVYIDLPVYAYYLPKYPDLELTGRAGREGLLRHRFPQERHGALRPVQRGPRPADRRRINFVPFIRNGTCGTTTRRNWPIPPDLPSGAKPRRKAGAGLDYLWYLLGGAWVTVQLSVLGMLLAVASGDADRA